MSLRVIVSQTSTNALDSRGSATSSSASQSAPPPSPEWWCPPAMAHGLRAAEKAVTSTILHDLNTKLYSSMPPSSLSCVCKLIGSRRGMEVGRTAGYTTIGCKQNKCTRHFSSDTPKTVGKLDFCRPFRHFVPEDVVGGGFMQEKNRLNHDLGLGRGGQYVPQYNNNIILI